MKLFIVAAVLGVAAAGRLDNTYLPPSSGSSGTFGGQGFGGSSGFQKSAFSQQNSGFQGNYVQPQSNGGQFGAGFQAQHSGNAYNAPAQTYNNRQQSSYEANAQILKYSNDVNADGFAYDFETSNGIRADAQGVATNGVQSQGSFGYKGDDGQEYSVTYTADENGYRPQGAHLPTPPPIPEAILKSLEQNARDEAAGISDDGSYHGEGAGAGGAGGYQRGGYSAPSAPAAPSNQYGAPNQGFQGKSFASNQAGFQGNQGSFQASQGFKSQGGFQAGQSFQGQKGFNAGASRQYLAPQAGRSGSGNFNQQSGYHY